MINKMPKVKNRVNKHKKGNKIAIVLVFKNKINLNHGSPHCSTRANLSLQPLVKMNTFEMEISK